MKILHTGDWHLGKQLEGVSRLEEQVMVLKDLEKTVKEENIDLLILAGDVYDTFNPSSAAETLFYSTLKAISEGGKRLILVIPGNHDNPIRLVAASPLAREHGIIMIDSLNRLIEPGVYGQHQVIESGYGYIKIKIKEETAVLLTLPYPSEKRLEESYFDVGLDDDAQQVAYSDRIRSILQDLKKHYTSDDIRLVVSHLFAMGAEETGSERSIQLGGTYIVDGSCFPKEAQYVALGHIHKPMIVPKTDKRVRYSGSLLQYNKKERNYEKGVYILDINSDKIVDIKMVYFKTYKPIEVWRTKSIEDAIKLCEEKAEESSYVYLEVETDRFIGEHEIKTMKSYKKDILEITPILDQVTYESVENITEEPIQSIFEKFYLKEKKVAPTEEITKLLLEILGEDHEAH